MGKYGPGRYGHEEVVVYKDKYDEINHLPFKCMIGACKERYETKKELKHHKETIHAI